MCVTTRWSGRPGIASCGAGWSVSVAGASCAFRRACVAAPLSALEEMLVSGGWVSCARRCASRLPRKALLKRLAGKKNNELFRAPVRSRPLQQLEMAVSSRIYERPSTPLTSVRVRPLQHIEVPTLRRKRARQLVPWATVRARPLQHIEVPAPRRVHARLLVPRAAVRAQPL